MDTRKVASRSYAELDLTTPHVQSDASHYKSVRFTSNIVGFLNFLRDILSFIVGAPCAYFAYITIFKLNVDLPVHYFSLSVMALSFFALRISKHAYARPGFGHIEDTSGSIFDSILSWLIASAVIFISGMTENYSRGVSSIFLITQLVFLIMTDPVLRILALYMANTGVISQRIAFYGTDDKSVQKIKSLIETLNLPHLHFVAVGDDRARPRTGEPFTMLQGVQSLIEMARRGELDQVIIAIPELPAERLREILEQFSSVAVDVSVIPELAIELSSEYRVNLLGSIPVLTLWQRPFRDFDGTLKRLEDLVFGVAISVVAAPIMLVCAALIKLSSAGPILFVQPRVGFNNEVISVYKFRTMHADQTDEGGVQTTTKGDARITPVGRVLRKLSLDELPQLFNVLKGDMSLVGPRPHATMMKVGDLFYQDAVRGYAGRHRVRPGITGLAQVKGLRGEIRTVERAKRRVELDKQYIDQWSLWLDLTILAATVRAVIFDKDAY